LKEEKCMKVRNEKFKNLMFYEIYPTSFYDSNDDGIGDLKGIETKLDYIKGLGFNAIWINPFYVSPFKDGGYDVANFFDVDPKFGTLDDFKLLIKKAKELDIKVVIDCIPCHASEDSREFLKSADDIPNEYSDLFIWTDSVWKLDPNYKLETGRHSRDGNYLVSFFAFQPALNFGFNNVTDPKWQMSYKDERTFKARQFVINFCKYWLELGVYGFRVDMASCLVKGDDNKEATIEVWNDIFNKIRKEYPNTFFVSEWSITWEALKAGFDCDFVLDLPGTYFRKLARGNEDDHVVSLLNGGEVEFFIDDLLKRYNASIENGAYLGHISGNHDTKRIAKYLKHDRLKLYYLFMFTMPGIPFMYYGDEIEMSHEDIRTKDGGFYRTGSRTPMQWDHTKNDGFSKADKIYLPVNTANNITLVDNLENEDSIYYLIKKLTNLRASIEDLQSAEMSITENNKVIIITRKSVKLVMNFSDTSITLSDEIIFTLGTGTTLKPFEGALVK